MNLLLMITYVISAVVGSTLMKYGTDASQSKPLFVLPHLGTSVSTTALLGIVAYGLSFMTYIVLLSRFDLSFISPLLLAIVYVMLMITAVIVFKEQFTLLKTVGCSFILLGIVLVLLKR
jgi:small multidrug resistance pump